MLKVKHQYVVIFNDGGAYKEEKSIVVLHHRHFITIHFFLIFGRLRLAPIIHFREVSTMSCSTEEEDGQTFLYALSRFGSLYFLPQAAQSRSYYNMLVSLERKSSSCQSYMNTPRFLQRRYMQVSSVQLMSMRMCMANLRHEGK